VSIALAIVEQVDERSDAASHEVVHAVHVRVGALSSVVPEALQFAWELATDGTSVDGAKLVIERVPLTIRCDRCDAVRAIEGAPIPVCPACRTPSETILGGRELEIVALEVCDAAATR
jgi:hydrogenase nickel incorporation protein HypA/HybF